MSLTKVLSLIGDENISYQNIESSALKMKANKKYKDCEITIATEFDMLNGCGKTGLIVWVDTDKLKNSIDKVKGKTQ